VGNQENEKFNEEFVRQEFPINSSSAWIVANNPSLSLQFHSRLNK
jgi:hypothetical protein